MLFSDGPSGRASDTRFPLNTRIVASPLAEVNNLWLVARLKKYPSW